MINFKKYGLILRAKDVPWANSHLWVPTAYKLDKNRIIVFFAGRNYENESDTGYFVYDINVKKVIKVSRKPILLRGELGLFDDSAAIPSHVIKVGKKYFMYYVGWTQGRKVPFFSSIGLAISRNIYGPYKKISRAPIIGKTREDPFFFQGEEECFFNVLVNKRRETSIVFTKTIFRLIIVARPIVVRPVRQAVFYHVKQSQIGFL